MRGVIVLLTRL